MSAVKVGLFKFGDEEFELRYVITQNKNRVVYFVAKDIAAALKYENTKKAIADHVEERYKITYGGHENQPQSMIVNNLLVRTNILYLHPQTVLINKSGVIQLIMKSKLSYAVELQEWLLEEVIPQVLCTGKYSSAAGALLDGGADGAVVDNEIVKQFQSQIEKKDDYIQNLIVQINRLTDNNNVMVKKLMSNVSEMYARLHETVTKTNEIMLQKDQQVNKLLEKLDGGGETTVSYPPIDNCKVQMICIGRKDNNFEAITGQKRHIRSQKLKRGFENFDILVETQRPNPILDWNNVTQDFHNKFPVRSMKRTKRSMCFDYAEDAENFDETIKKTFLLNDDQNSPSCSSAQQSVQIEAGKQAH
ncbi:baculovirus repeat orf-a [Alphabaculovirus altersperidaniae]|uniref:Baculovirus repeat orf-a n=1 Tax=Spodoptera eridania nucleopolyhedrovirus TaxID=2315721 RepID=A0ABX6TR57_9ABAC|nr:baculovirus repeat orf-a [Spodoptera eridania nucleopolyhedrovirus]QNV47880.1 baculovirus repeat orf-a [Spodoptera eridania nucleopolyhedrovirus]